MCERLHTHTTSPRASLSCASLAMGRGVKDPNSQSLVLASLPRGRGLVVYKVQPLLMTDNQEREVGERGGESIKSSTLC